MSPVRPWLLRLFLLGLVLGLTSCAPSLDAEQSRLCRMILPALFSEDDGIRVTASEAVGDGRVVHITFRAGGADARERLLTCRFGGTGYSAAKRDLVAVQLNGVGLSESQMWVIKDRWLETQAAVVADPGPPQQQSGFRLNRDLAVGLQHAIGALPRIGVLALLAMATALIYGLIGRIQLAIGEFASMGGILCTLSLLLFSAAGYQNPLVVAGFALLVVLCTASIAGNAIGAAILAPLADGRGQPMLVAGVGLILVMQEGLRLAQGSGTIWTPPVGADPMVIAAAPGFVVTLSPRLLLMVALNLAAVLGTLLLMRKSRFGREWRAISDDPVAARLMGIDERQVIILTSALATVLAALAGATISLNYGGMNFSGGTALGLTALIAAILGGIGSLGGALLGAVAIGGLQALWQALAKIEHWELANFMLITLVLVLRPDGFFGYADGPERKSP